MTPPGAKLPATLGKLSNGPGADPAARSPSENELYVILTVPVGAKVDLIDWPGTADSMGRVKIPPPARDVLKRCVQSFAQFAVPEMVVNEPDPPPEAPP